MRRRRTYENLSTGAQTTRRRIADDWKREGCAVRVARDRRREAIEGRELRRRGLAR